MTSERAMFVNEESSVGSSVGSEEEESASGYRQVRKKRRRQNRSHELRRSMGELDSRRKVVERKTRWMALLYFHNDADAAEEIIKSVYGDEITPEDYDWEATEDFIGQKLRSYKCETLKRFKGSDTLEPLTVGSQYYDRTF